MEIGLIEGAIALILKQYKMHLTSSKKSTIYFFMKFAQFEEWMLLHILWRFQITEQSSFWMSYTTVR